MADLLRLYSGKSWYPKFNLKGISLAKALKTYRDVGQTSFAELMEFQTTKQLDVDVVWGEGKIIDKNTVEVKGKKYFGKSLVIGTGSRPTIPDIPGVNLRGVMTYLDHPEIRKDPKRLVVIGGGKIGIGKAAMFRPFGIDVTVLEKYTCLPKFDSEVREFILRNLALRKVKIHERVEVKEIRGKGKVESVVADINGRTKIFPCDAVMLSIGLTPNSEIARPLGVEIGKGNEIVTNEKMETSIPGIYAVGDVAGPPFFMAIARKRGMAAARNIAGIEFKMDYSFIPEHIYTPPLEATYVGLTEAEARKQYKNVIIIKGPTEGPVKNAKPEKFTPGHPGVVFPVCGRMSTLNLLFYGQNIHGMCKAVVDADSRKYLGFHHVGDGAKVSFQYLSYLLKIGWTVDQMAELNEIFLNAEPFIQLTRLVAGYKELINLC
jgi:dihydrolipoamide dehydrogenase